MKLRIVLLLAIACLGGLPPAIGYRAGGPGEAQRRRPGGRGGSARAEP